MSTSTLGSVTLGYEPIWDQWRKRAGVRLAVDVEAGTQVDARHFLDAIAEQGCGTAQPLLLSVHSPALLQDLLQHPLTPSIWIEIQNDWLGDAAVTSRVRAARQRGAQLVWRGAPGQAPVADVKDLFHKTLRTLSPQEALGALRSSARQTVSSPIVAGSLYEGLASPALVEHALDQQDAWGVVGWPADEVLHGYRFKQIQPARHLVQALVQALDADESMGKIEQRMGDEPLLNYRFLRYANSAGGNLPRGVDSVRKGLMAMGYARVRAWLIEQLPQASNDSNLDPLRSAMVLRARIMERLSNAGTEGDLRREVFTCGIFSQMDLLVGEPLGATIHRLPLPGRVASAIVGQSGPYAPLLEVASALESGCIRLIREVCKAHRIATEEVNRALLRTLAANAP
jgi:EAL and modified HD-GYP domain-containing signal transduction protein